MDVRRRTHRTMSMAVKQEFTYRKPICPFISSTFQDFQVERDYLVKKVFPTIDCLCRERGTYFAPVDLRWGINDAQTRSGLVIQLCLEYVAHCSPFFICLLGERYGSQRPPDAGPLPLSFEDLPDEASWLDKNFLVAASAGYKWIMDHQTCSVTELEILQAAMQGDADCCYFYLRQPDHVENLFLDLPEEERRQKLEVYLPESDLSELRMKDLKARIVNRGLPIRYFQTPEELGRLVLEDWTNVVNGLYPSIEDTVLGATGASEMFSEWMAHETFAETRRKIFIRTPELDTVFEKLSSFARSSEDEPPPANAEDERETQTYSFSQTLRQKKKQPVSQYTSILLLVGDRGSGKTALLANWVKDFREECPSVKVFSHYVGSSAESTDVIKLLRRCTLKMRDDMSLFSSGDSDLSGGAGNSEDTMDLHHACEAFVAAVGLQPCVIIIDGVDELGQTYGQTAQQVKEFAWLPYPLPAQCKLIITTARSDTSYKALSRRHDIDIITVPLLSEVKVRQEVIEEHLAVHCKCLNEEQLDKVVRCRLSDRPLFLTVLANELRVFGVHSHLDCHLDSYVEASSVRDLWGRIILRWIKDYSWRSKRDGGDITDGSELRGWVADALRLIAVSRDGLSQAEILELLGQLGYVGDREVSSCDWALFRSAAMDALFERPGGLLNFFHQHFKEAVEFSLLGSVMPDASGQKVKVLEQDHVTHDSKPRVSRLLYHRHLADYFLQQNPLLPRVLSELPWQLERSGEMEKLRQFLMNPKVFLLMCGDTFVSSKRLEVISYWRALMQANYSPTVTYWQMLKLASGDDDDDDDEGHSPQNPELGQSSAVVIPHILKTSASSQSDRCSPDLEGVHAPASERLSFSIRSNKQTDVPEYDDWEEESEGMRDSDRIASSRGDRSSSSCTDLVNGEEMARLAMCAGQLLSVLGHFVDAKQMLLNAHTMLTQLTPLTESQQLLVSTVQESLASLYLLQQKRDKAALWYTQALDNVTELLSACTDEQLVKVLTETRGRLTNQLGHMMTYEGKFHEAEQLLLRAKGCYENAGSWVGRACVQYHIGVLRLHQGEFDKAESHMSWALTSLESWYGKCHPRVADVLNDLASLFCNPSNKKSYDVHQAESMYRRALRTREKIFGADHLLVATTLHFLGKLLSGTRNLSVQSEAVCLLKRSLDIRTTKLGTDHKQTVTVRRLLHQLESEMKSRGKGSGAREERSSDRPYSSLSWREPELNTLKTKSVSESKVRFNTPVKRTLMTPESPVNDDDDSGTMSKISDDNARTRKVALNDDQLSDYAVNLELLAIRRKQEATKENRVAERRVARDAGNSSDIVYIDNFANFDDDEHLKKPRARKKQTEQDSQHGLEPKTPDALNDDSGAFEMITPSRRSNDALPGSPRPVGIETTPTSSHFIKRLRSAPSSCITSPRPFSSMDVHRRNCYTPGPHTVDVENAFSAVYGNHSSLESLLGPKPCPRYVSSGIHHKAAWYHVPGRYQTMCQPHPPKRLQKRVKLRNSLYPDDDDSLLSVTSENSRNAVQISTQTMSC